ncbi:hypothetical protein LSUCC0031_12135 [Rhodobacterales bacterium LSUCC0031]|nr:hypothetical protein [Rhodobacterales bacterium LSUCC0031]
MAIGAAQWHNHVAHEDFRLRRAGENRSKWQHDRENQTNLMLEEGHEWSKANAQQNLGRLP